MGFAINDAIKSRVYKNKTGIVTDIPFEESSIGHVTVLWDGAEKENQEWIPSIMHDEDAEQDWSDLI